MQTGRTAKVEGNRIMGQESSRPLWRRAGTRIATAWRRVPLLSRGYLVIVIFYAVPLFIALLVVTKIPLWRVEKVSYSRASIAGIHKACELYMQDYGIYPPGGNREIVEALTKQAGKLGPYLDLRRKEVNDNGEMLDPWNTPLRFVRGEDGDLKIISAGPDRRFDTADDVTMP